MIDTTKLVRCRFGDFWAIGSKKLDLQSLDYSLFNYNATNSQPIKLSDDFEYILVSEDKYHLARARNMVCNFKYNYKKSGKKNNAPWKICLGLAKQELNSIRFENFLGLEDKQNISHYNLGTLEIGEEKY